MAKTSKKASRAGMIRKVEEKPESNIIWKNKTPLAKIRYVNIKGVDKDGSIQLDKNMVYKEYYIKKMKFHKIIITELKTW